MREAAFAQMMRGRVDVKKLKFSTTELRALALQTHFSVEEVQALYSGFRLQAGERKPLEGGLNAVSLLGLFKLSNACSFVFADRFARLFWQHRTQDRGIDIGFEEFVRLLSIWTRVLFHIYDRGNKGYIVKEDIVDIMLSLFLCFLKSGVASYDWNSDEFKAKMAQEILSEWAEAAIRVPAVDNPCPWSGRKPMRPYGCLDLAVPRLRPTLKVLAREHQMMQIAASRALVAVGERLERRNRWKTAQEKAVLTRSFQLEQKLMRLLMEETD